MTSAPAVKSIFPFVPAKDFETSTQFYKDLGFQCPADDDDVRVFRLGAYGFLLQDFYVEDLANNFMIDLHVEDVDAWYHHIQTSGVTDRYDARASQPKLEDWGMIVMHLVDPSGVLWHVTQFSKTT